mgnify:CR=1 FL=1
MSNNNLNFDAIHANHVQMIRPVSSNAKTALGDTLLADNTALATKTTATPFTIIKGDGHGLSGGELLRIGFNSDNADDSVKVKDNADSEVMQVVKGASKHFIGMAVVTSNANNFSVSYANRMLGEQGDLSAGCGVVHLGGTNLEGTVEVGAQKLDTASFVNVYPADSGTIFLSTDGTIDEPTVYQLQNTDGTSTGDWEGFHARFGPNSIILYYTKTGDVINNDGVLRPDLICSTGTNKPNSNAGMTVVATGDARCFTH